MYQLCQEPCRALCPSGWWSAAHMLHIKGPCQALGCTWQVFTHILS